MCKRMTTRNRTRTLLTLAVMLGVFTAFSGSLQAVLVYEPFDYPAGKVDGLAVNAVGLTGTWSANYTDDTASIKGGSLTYSTLPTAGIHWGPRGGAVWTSPWIEATLDPAVMAGRLDDGDELWFSFVGNLNIGGVTLNNGHRLQIGADVGNNVAIYVKKIADGLAEVRAAITIDSSETLSTDSVTFTENRRLFVGRVIFGPTDTVEVYLPGPDLVKPENPAGTVTGSLDQSTFDMLRSQVTNGNSGVDADEIRIGTTYDDVVGVVDPTKAENPDPADGAGDVARTPTLTWTPGEFAAPTNGHIVYFGESFNDVNDATGAVAQSAASYTPPQRLDFGSTYYWRVDEVNTPPDSTIFKGSVWNFTTEPVGYPIDGANITATASSSMAGSSPQKTIDSSGLDDSDLHSTDLADMWLSDSLGTQPTWIEYQFDKVCKLHEIWVWNQNQVIEPSIGYGFKDVTIEYSVDGIAYTTLGTTHEFAQAPGAAGYAPNTTIDFGGVAAKYVRLTANSNWGGILAQYGLSEVQFFSMPVMARKPSPASGATDVGVDAALAWRGGREADKHEVYLSTDEQAVIDGTAPVVTVTEVSYAASLDLATTYYWRIDEVNDAETPAIWQGDIWSFSTQGYLVVEDFESYNDIAAGQEGSNLIYMTWADGFDNPSANGSTIGYTEAFQPSMETSIVYGDGKQSVPLFYNNTIASYSEVSVNTDGLAIGRDWTKGSPTTMTLRFYGDPNNAVTEQLYVKIGGSRVDYPGDPAELARPRWTEWPIDLTGIDLSNVPTLAVGFERTGAIGGTGIVYLDEIHLDRSAPEIVAANPVLNGDFEYWSDHPDAGNWAWVTTIQDDPGVAWYVHDTDDGDSGPWLNDGYSGYQHIVGTNGGRTAVISEGDTASTISQNLDVTIFAGETYTFSIDIFGDGGGGEHWAIGIGAEGMSNQDALERQRGALAISASNAVVGDNYPADPGDYTVLSPPDVFSGWQTRSVSYTATAADAGKKIVVFFSGGFQEVGADGDTCFDSAILVVGPNE